MPYEVLLHMHVTVDSAVISAVEYLSFFEPKIVFSIYQYGLEET